jgi:hypothetical protein
MLTREGEGRAWRRKSGGFGVFSTETAFLMPSDWYAACFHLTQLGSSLGAWMLMHVHDAHGPRPDVSVAYRMSAKGQKRS